MTAPLLQQPRPWACGPRMATRWGSMTGEAARSPRC